MRCLRSTSGSAASWNCDSLPGSISQRRPTPSRHNSTPTVERDWAMAKAWLHQRLSTPQEPFGRLESTYASRGLAASQRGVQGARALRPGRPPGVPRRRATKPYATKLRSLCARRSGAVPGTRRCSSTTASRRQSSEGRCIGPVRVCAPWHRRDGRGLSRARFDPRRPRTWRSRSCPPHLTSDPERLARFEREARLVASLNHPHIGAIYGVDESDGRRALVMELVEGEDLSQRLARGPIPVPEALSVARQIAEALEAAHEQGISPSGSETRQRQDCATTGLPRCSTSVSRKRWRLTS